MKNGSGKEILKSVILAIISLLINGLGIHLTIRAGIGASPWDVLNLGLSKSFGMIYGNASIMVSMIILLIDIFLKEPIGLAMFIDAIVVGKSVDFFNWLNITPVPNNLFASIVMTFIGLFIIGYTQFTYMYASLGCGPRDTLLVGLSKRIKRIPIGAISIIILTMATLSGYLLGGKAGVGTLICAFFAGPIMQFAFQTVRFDATKIKHQNLKDSLEVIVKKKAC